MERTRHLGFVAEGPGQGAPSPGPRRGIRPLVVVTTGGGDGAADLVAGTLLDAIEAHGGDPSFDTIILPGPLVPAQVLTDLRRRTEHLPVTIEEFVPSTSPFMAAADLVVCTAGYNTSVQLLQHGRRAIMIPRMMHRREQFLRASQLHEAGLVELLPPADLSAGRLWDAISTQLASPAVPLEAARAAGRFKFDGAQALAAFCADLIAERRQLREATS